MKRIETHPESAASIKPWFSELWNIVKDFDYKLIGKPYGCSPILEALNINDYQRPGIEHDLIKEIDYADYTLGNSLGIAIGMKIAQPNKSVFVLLSDAQLYMGAVLEAFILIKEYNFKNMIIAIDFNEKGSREYHHFKYNNLNLFKRKNKIDEKLNIIIYYKNKIKIFG